MNALTKLAPHLAEPEIQTRQVPESVPQWLDALAPDDLPSARFVARAEDVAGLLPGECASWLRMDIANLARSFAARAACRDLEVRLDRIDDDACSRFHRDHVSLRLLCAYRGPGTQWVPGDEAEQALHEQQRFRGTVNELPRFAVGIFEGRNRASGGVLHRSPPILGTNVTRLLLCLTPAGEICGCPADH
ncbi:MAG: DUF1826 domain-containing protein [Parvibaculum sp.]|nr:DUF1826 domain-containing protein [Parvibaculum sp.]